MIDGWRNLQRAIDHMRDLFEQIVAEGEPAILRLVAEKRQEGVDLDFKEKTDSSTGEPNRNDRRILGIALSALSNSMGGLLIWGIEARKNEDQVDCAIAAKPIMQIDRFKGEVVRLLSQVIMPPHEGIAVEAVPSSSLPGTGYLLVLVERSERRPHRCEVGEKLYFKRIGDSSMAMEHYDIEDSFKRIVVPDLVVEYSVRSGIVGPDGIQQTFTATLILDILLINQSPVSARFPYLAVERLDGPHWVMTDQRAGIHPRAACNLIYFEAPAETVIHPDTSMVIAVLRVRIPATSDPMSRLVRIPSRHVAGFRYRYGCLNSRQKVGSIAIEAEEIVRSIPNAYLQ